MYSKKVDESKKVDNYFSKNLAYLREAEGISMKDFAEKIGTGKSIIGNYEKGTAEPSVTTVQKIVQHFGITFEELMQADLSLPVHKGKGKGQTRVQPNVQGNVQPNIAVPKTSYTIPGTSNSGLSRVNTQVVDTVGLKLVPVVDIKAAAGDGYLNPDEIDQTQVMRLPNTMVKSGYHLCVRVKGPSMAPTYQDGGYLIIRLLERSEWLNMRNEYCYVIVDVEGKTYVKRVKNRFSGEKGGFITCMSDNPDKMSHPNFNLHPEEIQYLWYVEWYLTAKMPNIHDQYYSRVSNLEDKVDLLTEEFRRVQKQLK